VETAVPKFAVMGTVPNADPANIVTEEIGRINGCVTTADDLDITRKSALRVSRKSAPITSVTILRTARWRIENNEHIN
jgi:hypothetical protein